MPITIVTMQTVKTVTKPWGYERWIADGSSPFRYALKEIFIKAGNRSSVQFHEAKQETNVVREGRGILHYSNQPVDIPRFKAGGYSPDECRKLVESLQQQPLEPGTVFHVQPGLLHRVESVEDLLMTEASTTELHDVFRISDDANRPGGRIDSEHTSRK
jgi:D-lyxose ketol-isomerase